ncbi:MAG: hypothetical protein ABR987_18860 [Terracidiphilus sp.]|jgi:hypothetical protein
MRRFLFLMCILGVSCVSLAQGKSASWGNLNTLQAGDKIQVVQTNSTKVSGDFLSVSEAAISLQAKAGTQIIQKQDVAGVKQMRNKHRLRNALIVGGIGAGVGAGIGAAAHQGCASQSFCLDIGGRSLPAAIGGVVGLLGGATIGAFSPLYETVYSLNSH